MPKQSPDEEFRDDWKKFVGSFLPRKFQRYDWNDTRDGPGDLAKDVVNAIEKGDPHEFIDRLYDQNIDYFSEQEYQAYKECQKEFAQEWENPDDILDGMENYSYFQDDFNEIYEEREENNWWALVSGLRLFVWNVDNQVSLGWIEEAQDAETELVENEDLRNFLNLSGLTESQKWEIIANGFDYDVQGMIGVITDASDLLKAMIGEPYTQSSRNDEGIVAFHNGLVGSGYYLPTDNPQVHLDPKKKMVVDFGSYSLGDVYGAADWTWR